MSSAGITRGLIEASSSYCTFNTSNSSSSAGITRGLIEARVPAGIDGVRLESSAGITRGLIEATL